MQLEAVRCPNEAFLITLRSKIEKKVETEEEKQSIEHIMRNIKNYMLGNEEEMIINQEMVGWKYASRGYVVKTWIADLNDDEKC